MKEPLGTGRLEGAIKWSESKHREKPSHGEKDQRQMSQAQPSEKKKWRYACRLFGIKSLKDGALWHTDPLLSRDSVNNDRF
jgi:hypothetical protein